MGQYSLNNEINFIPASKYNNLPNDKGKIICQMIKEKV